MKLDARIREKLLCIENCGRISKSQEYLATFEKIICLLWKKFFCLGKKLSSKSHFFSKTTFLHSFNATGTVPHLVLHFSPNQSAMHLNRAQKCIKSTFPLLCLWPKVLCVQIPPQREQKNAARIQLAVAMARAARPSVCACAHAAVRTSHFN